MAAELKISFLFLLLFEGVFCIVFKRFWDDFGKPEWIKMDPSRDQKRPRWSPGDQDGARRVPFGHTSGSTRTELKKEGRGTSGQKFLNPSWRSFWNHFCIILPTFLSISCLASILISFWIDFGHLFGYFFETELVWGSEA